MLVNLEIFGVFCFREIQKLQRDNRKEGFSAYLRELVVYAIFQLWFIPKYVLTKAVLIANGLTAQEYPLLHYLLFEERIKILSFVFLVTLVWFCKLLQRGRLKYQFNKFGFTLIWSIVLGFAIPAMMNLT